MRKIWALITAALLSVVVTASPASALGVQGTSCLANGRTFVMQTDSRVNGSGIQIVGVWVRSHQSGGTMGAKVPGYPSQYTTGGTSWVRLTTFNYAQVPNGTSVQLYGEYSGVTCGAYVHL